MQKPDLGILDSECLKAEADLSIHDDLKTGRSHIMWKSKLENVCRIWVYLGGWNKTLVCVFTCVQKKLCWSREKCLAEYVIGRGEILSLSFTALKKMPRTSLAVQCLRLRASIAGGTGSIPGRGSKISHASQRGQKKKCQVMDDFYFLLRVIFYNKMCWICNQKILRNKKRKILKVNGRASLVVQWLRICLPIQETWIQALVWEDSTCHGATKPRRYNYRACALEPASHN